MGTDLLLAAAGRSCREVFEHGAQLGGRAHALKERQAQSSAAELQLQSLGIAADAAPRPITAAEPLARPESDRIGVVGVHLRHDLGFGRNELCSIADLGQDLMSSKIDDATETRNKMRGFNGDAVEREICEPCEHLWLGVAREV